MATKRKRTAPRKNGEHRIKGWMLEHRIRVALVGCGGNGSQMLTGLARLHLALRALDHPGLYVVAFDPDEVSEANVGRQLFAPADVGQNKATVLIQRLNAFYGLDWYAEPVYFGIRKRHAAAAIVISCVDTARARYNIWHCLESPGQHPEYWLDLGNRAADGQVILGQPARGRRSAMDRHRLPTVLELYPQLADRKFKEDNTPSCSLAEALQKQELYINQLVVTQALQLLWQLFRHGKTTWHGSFINAATGRINPLAVDREAWARFGFHHYRKVEKPAKTKGRQRAL